MQYLMKLLTAVVSRLSTLTMNPIRNFFIRVQMMFNTNVIATKILKPVTKKFKDIFHIKPKSEEDYYSVGKLLIAKKLIAAAIVVVCIGVFAYFIFVAEPVDKMITTRTGIVTNIYYEYDDMDLVEFTGKANIKASNGSVVYTGDIKNGVCEGTGVLYNQSGVLVYEGEFAGNAYNGLGRGYALDGSLQYDGNYVNNVYEGEGILYYPSGQIQYSGGFAGGFYSGNGLLYSENGALVYEGTFQNGLYHGNGILYYEDGDRKYEGEFVMGSPHGSGTLYNEAGRPYYTGIVAEGDIAYESLIAVSLKDIGEMFYEEPTIYYTSDNTCYVYNTAQVALEMDCIVRIVEDETASQNNSSASGDDVGWYLPDEAGSAVALDNSESSQADDSVSGNTTRALEESGEDQSLGATYYEAQEQSSDADLPTDFVSKKQKIYYFVNNSEWVMEDEMDMESVKVEGVTVFKEDLQDPFKEDTEYIAANGVIELPDCIAIDKIRRRTPTVFSNITYEAASRNYQYIYVKNINYAQAIYQELIDTENFSYKCCYQIDDAEKLYYYKISGTN